VKAGAMLIVSIVGPSFAQAREQMRESERYADMFELRLDLVPALSVEGLLHETSKPILATCRSASEGGNFRGSDDELFEVLSRAATFGAAYVDIELCAGRSFIERFRAQHPNTLIVLSVHAIKKGKPNLRDVYRRMRAFDPDVMKFAFEAHDAADIVDAAQFLALARRDRRKAIAVAMGESGEASRVLYRKLGAWATFASTRHGEEAADGQIPAALLSDLYRARCLNASTKVFGVIGNPLQQSKGVYVHNLLFQKIGLNAVYCRFPVHDVGRFMNTCASLLNGFSVTIPHKQTIIKFLDDVDERAAAIGAVNTVLRRRGRWFGTNTDAPAALDAIEDVVKVRGKRVLVVGAGGAARAIACEARLRGAHVLIANRTERRARKLAREFGLTHVPLDALHEAAFDILANATSVGMIPRINESPVPKNLLRGKVVFDAVYNPPMTKLLRDACDVGARVIPGTEMYINQAALQFELYTGRRPSRAMMRTLLSFD
jgi:3-dehydroquinate dehydratase/shikimate dehydrogenase